MDRATGVSPVEGKSQDYLCIVQVTDTHLFADKTRQLLGITTHESLQAVISRIQQEVDRIDLIIATGDLSQDYSPESYQRFIEFVEPFNVPLICVPGNHDQESTFAANLPDSYTRERVIQTPHWQIILLDSHIDGEIGGKLDEDELELLRQALEQQPNKPTLIAMHHHPVAVGSTWIDRIGVANSEAFWQLVEQHPQVKAVVWGHVHQEVDQYRGSVRLLASPSTCVQFLPQSEDFALDSAQPGYRELRLYPDGLLETRLSRLEDGRFTADINKDGY